MQITEAVYHPTKGHMILRPHQVRAFIGWLAEMDHAQLIRQDHTWRWLAETRGFAEFIWYDARCREEMGRRGMSSD